MVQLDPSVCQKEMLYILWVPTYFCDNFVAQLAKHWLSPAARHSTLTLARA